LDAQSIELLTRAGVAGVLAFIVLAFIKEWIMVGTTVRRVLADKDKQIAYEQAESGKLRAGLDAATNELWEQVKLAREASGMADKYRQIIREVAAEMKQP